MTSEPESEGTKGTPTVYVVDDDDRMDQGLSERTVEIHRANAMGKMGARSVAHLVRMQLTLAGML